MTIIYEENGLTYELNNQNLTGKLIYSPDCNNSNIEIPQMIVFQNQEYLITLIDDNSFKNNIDIKSIIVPKTIITIGQSSFFGSSINSISISSSVIKIDQYSFSQCKNLKSINFSINSQLQSIGRLAFSESSISSIKIPSKVTQIDEGAFFKCKSLKTIEFSQDSQLETISKELLLESSIERIEIPSAVTTIKEDSFARCLNLKYVQFLPNSQLINIEESAFRESSLETILIPSNVEKIRIQTFDSCQNFKAIEFLSSSITIENFCFDKSENLTLASFPNSHQINITRYSFNGVSSDFTIFCLKGVKINVEQPQITKKYLCEIQ